MTIKRRRRFTPTGARPPDWAVQFRNGPPIRPDVPVKTLRRPASRRSSTKVQSPKRPVRSARERRRSPRVEILGELTGESLTFDSPVTVLDFSTGGFRIETSVPLAIDDTHQFLFALREGISVFVLAKVVHTRPGRRGSGTHIVGLQFLDGSADAQADRTGLVDLILAGR
jgi:hypothetical protein